MNFNEFWKIVNLFIFNLRFYKNASFHKFVLKPKSWILIFKDFDLFDIFIESEWEVFPYLHLCLKLMESKN